MGPRACIFWVEMPVVGATAFIAGEIERLGPVVKAADARLE